MDLPWILLFISVILIALIAWHSTRFSLPGFLKQLFKPRPRRPEPYEYHEEIQEELFPQEDLIEDELINPSARERKNLILAINLKSPKGKDFGGEQLVIQLNRAGLRFGAYNIFHYENLFSLASAFEPGTFDLTKLEQLRTAGLTFFMETAHLNNIREAFETMLETAQILSRQLHAELYDEQWKPLTPDTIERYFDRIDEVA